LIHFYKRYIAGLANILHSLNMDPGWPMNPLGSLICILCKSNMPYNNSGGVEKFFSHMENDHDTFFNIELLLKMSLMQPTDVRDEENLPDSENRVGGGGGPNAGVNYHSTRSASVKKVGRINSELGPLNINNIPFTTPVASSTTSLSVGTLSNSKPAQLAFNPFQTQPSMSLFQQSIPNSHSNQLGSTMIVPDFSTMDPISFVKHEPEHDLGSTNNLIDNSSPNLVPEDLQNLISKQNPGRNIRFTLSQRMNTQMVVDDYLLKKKKGPYLTKEGRVVNWKCVHDSCQYTAVTMEGQIQDMARQHNHLSQPEDYLKKQVRAKIRENMTNVKVESNDPVTSALMEVVGDTINDMKEKIGSVDAHKQAARRFNRKLLKESHSYPVNQASNIPSQTTDMIFTPASSEELYVPTSMFENCEVIGELPANFLFTVAASVTQ